MAHTPFGYAIVNGKIEVHAKEAEQLKLLIASYLSGQSLANAARESGINRSHGGITRILTDERYLGNEIFPRLISKEQFEQLKEEVSLEGKVNHTLFEIKIVNNNQQANVKIGQELKVKIPDYNGVFSVREVDYLAIEYNERYKKLLDLEK